MCFERFSGTDREETPAVEAETATQVADKAKPVTLEDIMAKLESLENFLKETL